MVFISSWFDQKFLLPQALLFPSSVYLFPDELMLSDESR